MKSWGADVTTTCSTDAVDLVKSVGADTVIDYKTSDAIKELGTLEKSVLYLKRMKYSCKSIIVFERFVQNWLTDFAQVQMIVLVKENKTL